MLAFKGFKDGDVPHKRPVECPSKTWAKRLRQRVWKGLHRKAWAKGLAMQRVWPSKGLGQAKLGQRAWAKGLGKRLGQRAWVKASRRLRKMSRTVVNLINFRFAFRIQDEGFGFGESQKLINFYIVFDIFKCQKQWSPWGTLSTIVHGSQRSDQGVQIAW